MKKTLYLSTLGGLLATAIGWGLYLFMSDHTTYAPGFSKEKFILIHPGLSEERVTMLLGRPLGEDIGPAGEVWHYKPQLPFALTSSRTRGLIVTFRPDGLVADVMGAPRAVANTKIHSGATAADVIRLAGLPERIDPPINKTVWYSQQQGKMGRYSVFAVFYDANGLVVGTEAEWNFD